MKTATTTRLMRDTTMRTSVRPVNLAITTGCRADVASFAGGLSPEPFSGLPSQSQYCGAYRPGGAHDSKRDRQPWLQSQGVSRFLESVTSAA